jgi:polyphenol oxidase
MMLNPVVSPDLSVLPGIRHAYFTREGGVSQGIYKGLNGGLGSSDAVENIRENRRRMASHLGLEPERLVSVWQVHSPDVAVVDAPFAGERPKADAMVTTRPGLALGITTADCGPILFADAKARVIGAAHAGWKGAFTGVIAATIEAMEKVGAHRANITAVLGPCIGATAYEVGPEFIARLLAENEAHSRFFKPSGKEGHALFDMPAFIALRAAQARIGHFVDLRLCTYSDETRFYSYRRTTHRSEPDYGRLISAICLT